MPPSTTAAQADRNAPHQGADARSRCIRCGTEYLAPIDECDWCPGVKPEPMAPAVSIVDGPHLQLVTSIERETVPGLL